MLNPREFRARYEALRARIDAAALKAGRDPKSVSLIAVSKRKSPDHIRAAYEVGIRDFGENYAQELRDKAKELADLEGLRWHFIGPLQTNKVRYVANVAHSLHTLASMSLAHALEKRLAAAEAASPLGVLIQLNIAGEETKSGLEASELPALLEALRSMDYLRCDGLMTMPPPVDDPADALPHFKRLAELASAHHLEELSMGMSHDFEAAIEAGATMVRVGTLIFGPRD